MNCDAPDRLYDVQVSYNIINVLNPLKHVINVQCVFLSFLHKCVSKGNDCETDLNMRVDLCSWILVECSGGISDGINDLAGRLFGFGDSVV